MEKKYLDYEGLQELVLKIKEYVGDAGHIEFKGAVANVASLPALNTQKVGWMWTIQAAGKTTSDFVPDGAGKTIAANSEVAAVKIEGTTENTIFSANDGSTYVSADLMDYTPTGTVGSGTKLCEVYIADGTETHLTEGTWYVTGDGSSFFEVTALGDTFADFTKTPVSNEDAIAELGDKYTGSAFSDLNKYTETVTEEAMKWCLLGPIFDVSDKLSFGDAFPSNPADGDTFLYMGETTFVYNEVTPEGSENPKALGWYESDGEGGYVLTEDETVDSGKTYYTKDEKYVKGVIYVYDETEADWQPQTAGDTMLPISNAEIDTLFA